MRRIGGSAGCAGRKPKGAPVCPVCGCLDIYDLTTRRRFKCAACHHLFSVTSGTILASRKLSFVDLLGAICLFVNASKGLSAVQLSRDLDVQYKTAFVLMHKLREVMAAETRDMRLSGHVKWTVPPSAGMSAPRMLARPRRSPPAANRSGKRAWSSHSGSAADQPHASIPARGRGCGLRQGEDRTRIDDLGR